MVQMTVEDLIKLAEESGIGVERNSTNPGIFYEEQDGSKHEIGPRGLVYDRAREVPEKEEHEWSDLIMEIENSPTIYDMTEDRLVREIPSGLDKKIRIYKYEEDYYVVECRGSQVLSFRKCLEHETSLIDMKLRCEDD